MADIEMTPKEEARYNQLDREGRLNPSEIHQLINAERGSKIGHAAAEASKTTARSLSPDIDAEREREKFIQAAHDAAIRSMAARLDITYDQASARYMAKKHRDKRFA